MVMLLLVAKYLSQRRRLAERDAPYHPTRRGTKLRIQRRYETIEHWIISKKATPHDDFCSTVVSNFCHHKNKPTCTSRSGDCDSDTVNHDDSRSADADVEAPSSGGWPSGLECPPSAKSDSDPMECPSSSPKLKDEKTNENCLATSARFVASRSSSSTPSEAMTDDELSDSGNKRAATARTSTDCTDNNHNSENDPRECPICMGELQAGQIVSWSANEHCGHVYHHECIKVRTVCVQKNGTALQRRCIYKILTFFLQCTLTTHSLSPSRPMF